MARAIGATEWHSMTRAIWATPWQKGFICRCHCLRCHYNPLTVKG